MKIIYINITNKCTAACPFCCMYSCNIGKHMSVKTFKEILDRHQNIENVDFGIQLEGGEPTENPFLIEMLSLFKNYSKIKRIYLHSNGLDHELLNNISTIYPLIKFKISFNTHLNNINSIKNLKINFKINARFTNIEDKLYLENILLENNINNYRMYELQNYGKYKNKTSNSIIIKPLEGGYAFYSSDGKLFYSNNIEKDLRDRSEYEKRILNIH